MIFIDADAYIALNVPNDANHQKSFVLTQKFSKLLLDTITSWDVVDEVATKLSRYQTQKVAKAFLDDVIDSTTRIEYVNSLYATVAIKLFMKQVSKKVSLTDCTNMVIARSLGITTFFSFDRHYPQNGFKLLG